MSNSKTLIIVAGLAAALGSGQAIAAGFSCPIAHVPNAPAGVEPISGLMPGLDDADESSRIGEAVARLRASGMPPGLIVDHVIGAFCPVVGRTGLSDAQKAARVRRFARQVALLVYAPADSTETAILVDIPLKPDILAQVDQAARNAKLSRDAWIERSISDALRARQ